MNYETLLTELADGIFTIIINRPDTLNALNKTVLDELDDAIENIYINDSIKSAIITGSGSKAFVAGADIGEFVALTRYEGQSLAERGQNLFFKIENCPKPIVAAVNGFALGGGCELAMACHFRIASENAKFGQPEVNLGLLPGYGGTQRLVQLIGKGRALEILFTCNMIDAVTAFNYGLVNHIAPQQELLAKVKSILSVINTKAPLAVAGCIKAVNAIAGSHQKGYETEAAIFGKLIATADAQEGISAFLHKRKPVFNGE
jgi:enoyl-CoA hydratase